MPNLRSELLTILVATLVATSDVGPRLSPVCLSGELSGLSAHGELELEPWGSVPGRGMTLG